jgi:hypothetical protein
MGYSKTLEPFTLSCSDSNTLATCGTGAFAVNAGAFYRYLYFTVVTEIASDSKVKMSLDVMATAPDQIWWEYRLNGTTVLQLGNYVGAWLTSEVNVNIPVSLSKGDTIDLYARASTGATAQLRNWKMLACVSPFNASVL